MSESVAEKAFWDGLWRRGTGLIITTSPHLITDTKRISWRNERKWAHRTMHNRGRVYRACSKEVPNYECIGFENKLFVPPHIYEKLKGMALPSNIRLD